MTYLFSNASMFRVISQLSTIGTQLALSNQRLATGKRVNTAADDPDGIVALNSLRSQLSKYDGITQSGQRISSILDTADGALTQISDLVDVIQTNVVAAGGDSVTAEDLAAYQANIDNALDGIDKLVNETSFNGKQLLGGDIGYTVTGVDTDKIDDVNISSSNNLSGTTTVTINLYEEAVATIESDSFAVLTDDVTFTITGPDGSKELTFASGSGRSAIAATVNTWTGTTGATALAAGGKLYFYTEDVGSADTLNITVTDGTSLTFDGSTSASATGVDTSVKVDGLNTSIDETRQIVHFSTGGVSGSFSLTDAFYSGADDSTTFYVAGNGADFKMGLDSSGIIHFGQSSLSTSNLGTNKYGYLSSLGSGGDNDLDSGNFTTAASIASAAEDQISTAQARFGSLKSYTVESALNSIEATKTALNTEISNIEDVDYVQETANNQRLQAMYELGLSLIASMFQSSSSIISLLQPLR